MKIERPHLVLSTQALEIVSNSADVEQYPLAFWALIPSR
jgi:hypothetical protein